MIRWAYPAALILPFFAYATAPAQRPAQGQAIPTIAARTAGLERHDGFFPFYYEAKTGKLLLEVARLDEEFLYLTSLATGIGSDALGLDRGTIGDEAVVHFERHGPRLLLVQRNMDYRARTDDQALIRSVRESFAISVRGAFPIVAEDGGRVLVDATEFFLADAFDVRGSLRRADEGSFRLDAERSAIWLPRTKAFPENTEVEALLTFASDDPGREIRRHTPDGRSLSLREHHSFVQLPPPGYEPRAFDPRVGLFPITFYDFARPLDEKYQTRWITRWRLECAPGDAPPCRPAEPIVYYLDPAIPEPYRTAVREGAMWWNEVFEAAGFIDAFQVKDLPPGADPMDARYSVIQWVHRSTPGFSIGPSFRDPRTGEIIKAAVRMDTYRSLTDYNIWAGTRPSVADGQRAWFECALGGVTPGDWIAALDPDADAEAFAMARRRQHAAHEVGHTLGLSHNFIAGSYGRASVMDYPGPLIKLDADGRLDLSDAYRSGPGAYDTLAIRYAYTPYPTPEAEAAGLEALVQDAIQRGLRFIADQDAGNSGSIPLATRWLNGSDAVAEVDRTMKVREVLLDNFSVAAIEPGEPMWLLAERFTPVYLHHRYALEAAIKAVGGMDYTYALAGDGQAPTRILEPARQRAALDRLIAALQPEALAIPEEVAKMIPPRPFGYGGTDWILPQEAAPAFDPLGTARALASFVVDGVLDRQRAARVVSFHARDAANPSFDEVVGRLIDGTWGAERSGDAGAAALNRVAERAVLDGLIALAGDGRATVEVRGIAEWHLAGLADRLESSATDDPVEAAHRALAVRDIRRFLERRDAPTAPSEPRAVPPGTPIGQRGH
ncbi:MAG TPA: zinc-dependent metalloprotease [Longimicrobiales bacterium]